MKYFVYGIICALFVAMVLLMPSRTVWYSFPRPAFAVRHARRELPVVVTAPAPRAAVVPVTPSSSTSTPLPVVSLPTTEVPIDLRSVVVVKCIFKNVSGNSVTVYGSGVMVGREGYVLTARHVVDMAYTHRITGGAQGLNNYVIESCHIAVPPESVKTPTTAEIRTLNPFTPVTEFAYNAQVAFVPPDPAEDGMSEAEGDFADSALLRITSAVSGTVPPSFAISPVKITELPAMGDEVVSFGFPSGVPSYGHTFYLQGSVGEIKHIVGGDRFFKDQPMGMAAIMETIGGRSGSPVFWRGYVIGVVSAKGDYSRNATIAGVYPLARFADEAGIAVFK